MEIYERIRELRKNHLEMSAEAFGSRLGVSRDTINNIELNRLARPEQKMSLYKLICSEFNVNENWLLNGIKPMFVQPSTFNLDQFVQERGATALELEIIKAYFELPPDIRRDIVKHFKSRFSGNDESSAKNPTHLPAPIPIRGVAIARSGMQMESRIVSEEEEEAALPPPYEGDL